MKLKRILQDIDFKILKGTLDIEVNKVEYDSRKVILSDMFICIKGYQTDGHKFIKSAISNGAKVIVLSDDVAIDDDITVIKVDDTRKALAKIGCNYFDNPSKKMKMIGVTGTNGKTTTAFMIKHILDNAGKKTGLIGTIANYIGDEKLHTDRTTPESFELQRLFKKMVDRKMEYCVMEVSSHSLALDRVYNIKYDIGIFTNITRDHLDFHKTFENYYKAKFKLFENSVIKVVNTDDKYGIRVVSDLKNIKADNIFTYSIKNDSDYKAYDEVMESMDIKFSLNMPEKEEFTIGIPGEYNISNGLAAIITCDKLGIDKDVIKKSVSEAVVPGRCERAGRKFDLPYDVIIDYAHTPDGLLNILKTARTFTKGRLISVFGCGGDRDKVKRPQMGKIGIDLSDIAIITSDNPRTENPMAIIEDIKKGLDKDNYIIIENRKEAIRKALSIAKKDDVIVIAGKGHETYQILKDKTIHFDEREVIDQILSEK
ncbi:UDP-N-acetylmuramoyl-L-alanyl-D-glutamate--2,6-diaminopimelate ligase [Clostridium sp. BJN0001]|uniref:UDP-N-acetylmuramoyl-L-alanyl-D-glutamate--2, 6-diaminopimelate ligase n=1 Tax=Clostridium sp. BJN0001 TaxID=2930219 RepID=UPI001FD0F721|nr:UDP-N-acetylmuramoyl-L-alanyl-D-glutamate--2,6-diaminopimelate ligase [Clostridium sp. BJN0001]